MLKYQFHVREEGKSDQVFLMEAEHLFDAMVKFDKEHEAIDHEFCWGCEEAGLKDKIYGWYSVSVIHGMRFYAKTMSGRTVAIYPRHVEKVMKDLPFKYLNRKHLS